MRFDDADDSTGTAAVISALKALFLNSPDAPPALQEWFDREARPALSMVMNYYLRPSEATTYWEVLDRTSECYDEEGRAVHAAETVMQWEWPAWSAVVSREKYHDAVVTLAAGFGIPSTVPRDLRWVMWKQWFPTFPNEMLEMLAAESGPRE